MTDDERVAVVKQAHRAILKQFRDKRKRDGQCQDCGAAITRYSRCSSCRRKRNARRVRTST